MILNYSYASHIMQPNVLLHGNENLKCVLLDIQININRLMTMRNKIFNCTFNAVFVVFTALTIAIVVWFIIISNSIDAAKQHYIAGACEINNCTDEQIPCKIKYNEHPCHLLNITYTLHLNESYTKQSLITTYRNECLYKRMVCYYDNRNILESLSLKYKPIDDKNGTIAAIVIILMVIIVGIELICVMCFTRLNCNCLFNSQPAIEECKNQQNNESQSLTGLTGLTDSVNAPPTPQIYLLHNDI